LEIVDNETLCGIPLEVLYEGSLTLAGGLRALYLKFGKSWGAGCLSGTAMIVDCLH